MLNRVIETNNHGIFIIQVFICFGSVHEKNGERGIAHMLEHMMFKTKKNMGVERLMIELNSLGGVFNAATSKDWTSYYIKTTKDNWEKSLKLMDSIVFDPTFTTDDLKKEKKVILEEFLQYEDDVKSKIVELSYKHFLEKGNPYRQSVKGDIATIANVDAGTLKKLHEKYYKNNERCFFYVSCPAKIKAKVSAAMDTRFKRRFGEFAPEEKWEPGCRQGCVVKFFSKEASQKTVCIMFEGFAHRDKRNIVLDYVWDVLTGSVNSLLMLEIREKRGLVYGINSITDPYRNGGVTGLVFQTSYPDIAKVIDYVLRVLKKIKKEGLRTNILKYTKASFINKLKYRLTDPEFESERSMWRHFYGCDWTEEDVVRELLKTKNTDVIEVCEKVFDFGKMSIVCMGNFKNVVSEEERIRKFLEP